MNVTQIPTYKKIFCVFDLIFYNFDYLSYGLIGKSVHDA